MRTSDIVLWLKENCENWPSQFYGDQYRAAAYVKGNVVLPCVLFQDKRTMIELYARRLRETNANTIQFDMLVDGFCIGGNRVSAQDIIHLELCEFAWPVNLIEQLRGETSMGFTCFVVEMTDGRTFNYGTAFSREFFDLPGGYLTQDILRVHSGMRKLQDGEIVLARSAALAKEAYSGFRELSFFTCFVDGLRSV